MVTSGVNILGLWALAIKKIAVVTNGKKEKYVRFKANGLYPSLEGEDRSEVSRMRSQPGADGKNRCGRWSGSEAGTC